MKNYPFSYRWQFSCKATPSEIWPYLSNTNRFFKDIGQLPVQSAPISHDKKKGYHELTYEQLHRVDIWEEEPHQWEAPYHLSVRRVYKSGYLKHLLFGLDISRKKEESVVTIRFSGDCKGWAGLLFTKKQFNSYFRRKIGKTISGYDEAVSRLSVPVKAQSRFSFNRQTRWASILENLKEMSGSPVISGLLIRFIETADDLDLTNIHPTFLARLWNKPLHEVIDVLLFATKIDILNLSWDMACPSCRKVLHNSKKLTEITDPLYCKECDNDVDLDFNHTVNLVFQVHPLLRKLSQKSYCPGSPQNRPHVVMQQLLHPGQRKFVKVGMNRGSYKIFTDQSEGYTLVNISDDGVHSATLSFYKNEEEIQQVTLSNEPDLILQNKTDQVMTIICEETSWETHRVAASQVTSLQLFRNLFPREHIRLGKKVTAKNLTILFTDLYNSSEIYSAGGDELAIRQVMDHFEILNRAIIEKRGAIVKTIGDAVMAVFPKPIYAVQAFNKAKYQLKEHSNRSYPIQLKGGIHSGDCTAVTLNNHIDYFGNTVNIASRLVEHAKGGELVISSEAYTCARLQEFIREKREHISIHHFDVSLKGFENRSFEAKKITLSQSPLRLVV